MNKFDEYIVDSIHSSFIKQVKALPNPPEGFHYEPEISQEFVNDKWLISVTPILKKNLI